MKNGQKSKLHGQIIAINQRSAVKKMAKNKGTRSEINGKKPTIRGQRKMAKNLTSAVKGKW